MLKKIHQGELLSTMAHSKSCFLISEGNSTVVIARLLSTMTLGDDGEENSVEIREKDPKGWKIILQGELLSTMAHSKSCFPRWKEIHVDVLKILLSTMTVSKTITEYLNPAGENLDNLRSMQEHRSTDARKRSADKYRELLSTMAHSETYSPKFHSPSVAWSPIENTSGKGDVEPKVHLDPATSDEKRIENWKRRMGSGPEGSSLVRQLLALEKRAPRSGERRKVERGLCRMVEARHGMGLLGGGPNKKIYPTRRSVPGRGGSEPDDTLRARPVGGAG